MAGTLTLDTLKTSSGVLATQNGMTGIAKAWVNFNGVSTTTINSSFNCSSVTRNSSGNYTMNFTTAMPNANYAMAGMATASASTTINIYASGGVNTVPALKSTTQCQFTTQASDCYDTSWIVFAS